VGETWTVLVISTQVVLVTIDGMSILGCFRKYGSSGAGAGWAFLMTGALSASFATVEETLQSKF
jgi:hypothetical protein